MHKYGYAPKNASVILYRNKALRRYQIFASSCTTTYALTNPTILSTKSGGPMAGSWATLLYLGEAGYQNIIRRVMEATAKLIAGVNGIPGLRVLGTPHMCMFSFAAEDFNIYQLQDEMKRRGWYLQPQFSTALSPENLHITVNANAVDGVDEFLADLRQGVAAVRACDTPLDLATVRAQVSEILSGHTAEEAIAQLQAMIGIEGSELPEGMAMLNSVMDALPNPVREGVLINYFNDLYT
jgi:glutamate/tyrosine decarboxylase-like PLP-dependent enzyme